MQRRLGGKASASPQLEAAPGETLRQTIQLTESPEAQLKTPAGAAEAPFPKRAQSAREAWLEFKKVRH